MKTSKELAATSKLQWSATRCPHCRSAELVPTGRTAKDSSGDTVTVYECPECEYSEGRAP